MSGTSRRETGSRKRTSAGWIARSASGHRAWGAAGSPSHRSTSQETTGGNLAGVAHEEVPVGQTPDLLEERMRELVRFVHDEEVEVRVRRLRPRPLRRVRHGNARTRGEVARPPHDGEARSLAEVPREVEPLPREQGDGDGRVRLRHPPHEVERLLVRLHGDGAALAEDAGGVRRGAHHEPGLPRARRGLHEHGGLPLVLGDQHVAHRAFRLLFRLSSGRRDGPRTRRRGGRGAVH